MRSAAGTPPAPTPDLGPLPEFPSPPHIPVQPPLPPRAELDKAAAGRLLALARSSRDAVARAIEAVSRQGASVAERRAADRANGCMKDLVDRVPDLDRAIDTLSRISQGGQGPMSLDLAQIKAIEAFAKCAEPLLGVPAAPPVLTAVAGVGLPMILSLLLSVL
jgi:hypothetical protein